MALDAVPTRRPKYVIVSPVRDEALHIGETIKAVTSQTILPAQWVIVDDGSTDGTGAILDAHAIGTSWMRVVHRGNRGYREAGGGVIEAFDAGYACVKDDGWEFIVKLDGDVSFAPDYFERCLEIFDREVSLGIGGGTIYRREGGTLRVDSVGDPMFHVRGATKVYRRTCWEAICPLVRAPGWDTIDEVKANQSGWTTRTFENVALVQHKPTGGADGRWRDWFKNGRANYMTGYYPAFMLAKCVKRAMSKPYMVASIALFAGYWSGYLGRVPQAAETGTIRYVRSQQMRRMLGRRSIYDRRR